ncbi:MAG: MmgE/PrpD family protein [Pseudooceanicola nanhaiensis]
MTDTMDVLLDLALRPAASLPDQSRRFARFSLFDWTVCGLAGASEPVATSLRSYLEAEAGTETSSVIGGGRLPPRAAAMANGTTSHALDYDDTHFGHVGHMSVGVYPAALAVGEAEGASAAEVVDAFLVGAEAGIRVGLRLGLGHYDRGFHQTATAGAFGATVAAGRLMGLDRDGLRAALGLCATRASGLKSQFGTMGKPLNAGMAASNGVECAGLARAGLTSADDGIDGPQGFVPTHSDNPDPEAAVADPETFLFDDIKYKLHACCHGTHAMLEALASASGPRSLDDVASVTIATNPRWLKVCDIKHPRTGLEVKFSYAWLAGMALRGDQTASDRTYTDACAADPALSAFAEVVEVAPDDTLTDMQVRGQLRLRSGEEIALAHDLAAPIAPDVLGKSLRRKARVLIGDRAEELWSAVESLDTSSARDLGALIRR